MPVMPSTADEAQLAEMLILTQPKAKSGKKTFPLKEDPTGTFFMGLIRYLTLLRGERHSKIHQSRFEPGPARWEARMLPLCYAAPPNRNLLKSGCPLMTEKGTCKSSSLFTTTQPTSDLSHQLFTLSFETKRKTNFIDFLLLTFAIKLQKQFLQNNKIGERFENYNNLRPLSFF